MRNIVFCCVRSALAVLALFLSVHAQQPNSSSAMLSIAGTGRVDGGGNAIPTSSMVTPTPAGSAPFFHHRTTPLTAIELRVEGPPLTPFVLLGAAGLAPAPIPVGGDFFELDLASTVVLVDGLSPQSVLDLSAVTGPDGTWSLLLPGISNLLSIFHLQAVLLDCSPGCVFRFTATVTIEVRNDVDTTLRNFADAATLSGEHPAYLAGLMTSDFTQDGQGKTDFIGDFSFGDSAGERLRVLATGPNDTTLPPLPTTAPTPGQTSVAYGEFETIIPTGCVASGPEVEMIRAYDLLLRETNGLWRVAGNQRDACIAVRPAFVDAPGAPNNFVPVLVVTVSDEEFIHGGISSVSLSGPQLAGLCNGGGCSPQATSTSSANGTASVPVDFVNFDGTSCWELNVQLASAGSSRQPLVENGTGPRDVYDVTINWNDGFVSGPYSIPLRAATDPFASPAAVAAAIPAAPTGALNTPGGNATITVGFNAGALPGAAPSSVEMCVEQGGADWDFGPWAIDATQVPQSFMGCAPGAIMGFPITVEILRFDVFGAVYFRDLTFTP